jgi:hypothetical protein
MALDPRCHWIRVATGNRRHITDIVASAGRQSVHLPRQLVVISLWSSQPVVFTTCGLHRLERMSSSRYLNMSCRLFWRSEFSIFQARALADFRMTKDALSVSGSAGFPLIKSINALDAVSPILWPGCRMVSRVGGQKGGFGLIVKSHDRNILSDTDVLTVQC